MPLQMSSNRALVDTLECCMDDLVECFEDFVKKSLILIFLGIGVIVGLLCYLLKMVSERHPLNPLNSAAAAESRTRKQNELNAIIEKKEKKISNNLTEIEDKKADKIDNNIVIDSDKDKDTYKDKDKDTEKDKDKDPKTAAGINTTNLPKLISFDEKILRENACGGGSSTYIYTPSRVPVPSLPISSSKHKLIPCIRKRSLNKSNIPALQITPKVTKQGSCCSMCCNDEPKRNEDVDRQILYRQP